MRHNERWRQSSDFERAYVYEQILKNTVWNRWLQQYICCLQQNNLYADDTTAFVTGDTIDQVSQLKYSSL